jgi:hypothetical protein
MTAVKEFTSRGLPSSSLQAGPILILERPTQVLWFCDKKNIMPFKGLDVHL